MKLKSVKGAPPESRKNTLDRRRFLWCIAAAALIGVGVSGWIDETTLTVLKRYALYLPFACACCLPILPACKAFLKDRPKLANILSPLATAGAVLLALVSLLFLVGQSYNPFIYFRF